MTTIKTYPHSLAAAILALAGFAANASATPVVNINLGNASNANVLNGTAYLTGGFAQAPASYTGTAWNDYSVSPVTLATALLDSDGNVTTVGLDTNSTTTVGNNLQGPATSAGGADVKLLKGYVNRVYNSSSGSNLNHRLTISGLDIAKTYNIYLASAHNTPVKCSWRIGATGTDKFITNTPATRTAQTWVAGDDYVAFYKVAPDAGGNILVYGQGLANNDGGAYSGLTLNGIQVMDATGFLSPENDMLTCAFGALGSAWITGSTTNLTLYAPTGTDVTALEPTFTLSPGATIAPTGPQDFTSPVAYTVYAEDGTPKVYTISVVVGPVPVFVSNALTPWEPASPGAGVRIDILVPSGESALLVGRTQTHWGSGGFSRSVLLNGNTFILDSGGGNGANYAGPISGDGAVIIQNNGQTIGGSLGNTYTGTTNVNTVVTLNKSSGNALCGTITGTGAAITWSANDQIDDTSDVTLNSASHLTLGAHTETIGKLYLVTGAYVDTGAGGILKVSELYLNGVQQAPVGKGSGDGFVLGTGYIDVANSGPPVIATVPDKPASPVPTSGTTGLHPMFVTLLNWADAAGATNYDVYLWDASGSKPGTPTATGVPLSQYAPTLPLNSNATYNWQVVAQNLIGPTDGDVWTFTTTDASYVSNVLTPWEPANPGAGVRIDTFIPSGGTAVLVGLTTTHWGSGGFSRAVDLNGNTFILDSGGGNGANYAGPISGNGTVSIQHNGQTIGGSLGNTYTGTTNVNTVVTLNKSSGNALCGTTTGTGAVITWAANDQINDASSVTLVSGSSLALAGHTETIASLTLATGTSVNTGTDGVLTVGALTVDGTVMPSGTYTSADGFVTGTGSVVVSAAGTPYEIWAAANAGGQTPGEDYDSDGVQNGVAFFMGMNGLATNPGVVNGKVTWPNGGNIPSPAYGTQFVVQTSTDLVNWADVLVGDLNLNNTSGSVAYTLPTGDAKQFCRLSVTP